MFDLEKPLEWRSDADSLPGELSAWSLREDWRDGRILILPFSHHYLGTGGDGEEETMPSKEKSIPCSMGRFLI